MTWAGSPYEKGEADGPGRDARFSWGPLGLTIDRDGNLYVADIDNGLIRKINKEGVVTTLASLAPEAATAPSNSQLTNASVRVALRAQQPLVVSLEVQGSKPVLLRAIGPGLRPFLPAASLADDPRIDVYDTAAALVNSNDNWSGPAALRDAFAAAGAFPLDSDSRDAALSLTLADQNTLQVTSPTSGAALFELYDLAPGNGSRVTKYRARYRLAATDERLFAGFTISGTQPSAVLIRGLGPGVFGAGRSSDDVLGRVILSVFGSDGQLLADNDAWPSTLAAQFVRAGAPALQTGSKDAALALTLSPGSYVAVLRGSSGAIGEGMLELYASD